jgi:hypothetical protein
VNMYYWTEFQLRRSGSTPPMNATVRIAIESISRRNSCKP